MQNINKQILTNTAKNDILKKTNVFVPRIYGYMIFMEFILEAPIPSMKVPLLQQLPILRGEIFPILHPFLYLTVISLGFTD